MTDRRRSSATPVATAAWTSAATSRPSRISGTASLPASARKLPLHALDADGASGLGIDPHDRPLDPHPPGGRLEPVRHARAEALDRQLLVHADHRVEGAG